MGSDRSIKLSAKAAIALGLSVVSLIILPLSLFIEFAMLFVGAIDQAFMDSGSFIESMLVVIVIIGFFVVSLAPPIAAFLLARSSRRDIREAAGSLRGSGLALSALIITAVAVGLWLLSQLYLASLIAGIW